MAPENTFKREKRITIFYYDCYRGTLLKPNKNKNPRILLIINAV